MPSIASINLVDYCLFVLRGYFYPEFVYPFSVSRVGVRQMSRMPFLCDATVMRQDPDNYRLYVSLDVLGGQATFLPVDVVTHGPRDAVRGNWPALPAPGTRGMVAFTRGDDRMGRWLGATAPALQDSSTLSPGHGNTHYHAKYAGGWSWTGQNGAEALVAADGSSLLLGHVMPVPTRHIVDGNGQRVSSVFTPEQRNPNPPTAFPFTATLQSGASVSVTSTGAVVIAAAAGQPMVVEVPGGGTLTLGADGSATLASSGGAILSLTAAGTGSITASEFTISSGAGAVHPVNLETGGGGSPSTVLMAQ